MVLGRYYAEDEEDDQTLLDHLLSLGAPKWVQEAEGWTDDHGWGLIGPVI